MGRIGPPKCRQNVEGPGLEVVTGEHGRPLAFQMAGEPANPRKHLEGRYVDIRKRLAPSGDKTVDFVFD
jgi:hypothetical protein